MTPEVKVFFDNFISTNDDTPIVIYGLGQQTKDILSQCPDNRIIGVLDGYTEEGEFCGKTILSLNSIANTGTKVVIIARAASEKIIYRRIKDFCANNGISVYNIKGENLAERNGLAAKESIDCEKSSTELLEKCKGYDAISFDIFDTLVTRRISNRETIYEIVGKMCESSIEFAKARIATELRLSTLTCPTIDAIYADIEERYHISSEESDRLKKAELCFEKWNIIPRKDMVGIYNALLAEGKIISIVSDMYFSKGYLTGILDACGIQEYQELLVSCEYGTSKTRGLFGEYKRLVYGNRYLHIGDSVEVDDACAAVYGIDSYIIKSASDMAELTNLGNAIADADSSGILSGMVASRLYNSPFAKLDRIADVKSNPYETGYALLGPVVVGFVQWMINKAKESNLGKICFISRDGFLPIKIYEQFAENDRTLPESVYLKVSRRLGVIASIFDESDIEWAYGLPFSGSIEERLIRQFQIPKSEISSRLDEEDEITYLLRHSRQILKIASTIRENYEVYLKGLDIVDGETGLVDFVSTGTCQLTLERILGKSFVGLYFDKIDSFDCRKNQIRIESFVSEIMQNLKMEDYFLVENWIKDSAPSIVSISTNGDFVMGERRMDEAQEALIHEIQKGAVDFCKDILKITDYGMDVDIRSQSLVIVPYISEESTNIPDNEWVIYDEFTGRKVM